MMADWAFATWVNALDTVKFVFDITLLITRFSPFTANLEVPTTIVPWETAILNDVFVPITTVLNDTLTLPAIEFETVVVDTATLTLEISFASNSA